MKPFCQPIHITSMSLTRSMLPAASGTLSGMAMSAKRATISLGTILATTRASGSGVELVGMGERSAPALQSANGLVACPIKTTQAQDTRGLEPNMGANTRIVRDKREDVWGTPPGATQRDNTTGQAFVATLPVAAASARTATSSPATNEVALTLGLKDRTSTEIVWGHRVGQVVVAPPSN